MDAVGHRAPEPSSKRRPAIFYLHPWEIDPDQPRLQRRALEPVPALPEPRARPKTGCAAAAATSSSRFSDDDVARRRDRETTRRTSRPRRCPTYGDAPRRVGDIVRLQIAAAQWDAFVDAHPEATGYHRWRWREVFERAFGHETVYLAAARRRRRPAACCRSSLFEAGLFGPFAVSLPFLNYGGVLADDDAAAAALVERARDVARERRAGARRAASPLAPVSGAARASQHKVAMLLDLPATRGSWRGTRSTERCATRSARRRRAGLTASKAAAPNCWTRSTTCSRATCATSGTPVYSRALLRRGAAAFPERRARVRRASTDASRRRGHHVSGSATASRCRGPRRCASIAPTARTTCSTGRSSSTGSRRAATCSTSAVRRPDEGTFHFKKQWGAEPSPLYWEYILMGGEAPKDLSPKNPKFGAAIAVWKRLPVSVTTALGPHIVRSIP